MDTLDHQKNADRFTGFADLYERARPSVPRRAIEIICNYLENEPNTVVDLGCGTGLSTLVWKDIAKTVIGIEPNPDMISIAEKKAGETVRFLSGYGNKTGLPSDFADVVLCSQSFHWMEPFSTLTEVNRILKSGGIFATIDCDWPPVTNWRAEKAYMALYEKSRRLESELPGTKDSFQRYPKNRHLDNMRSSGCFRYCREIVFFHSEEGDAERFLSIILSQGSLQALLKKYPELISDDLEHFQDQIRSIFGSRTFPLGFCYRMRIGIK